MAHTFHDTMSRLFCIVSLLKPGLRLSQAQAKPKVMAQPEIFLKPEPSKLSPSQALHITTEESVRSLIAFLIKLIKCPQDS